MYENMDCLIDKKVLNIYMNEDFLKFKTDKGNVVFTVEGDCCSTSVFYDFIGVKKLFNNGAIKSFKEIELNPTDIVEKKDEFGSTEQTDKKSYQECISVYGYEVVTEDAVLGDVTSVFSFRNYSNGYYGGSMELTDDREVQPEIFDDVIETRAVKD